MVVFLECKGMTPSAARSKHDAIIWMAIGRIDEKLASEITDLSAIAAVDRAGPCQRRTDVLAE
jgi:hypothetical protein